MTDKEFVRNVKIEVFDKMFNRYFETLHDIERASVKHPYWKAAVSLYDTLDCQGKEDLRLFTKLVMEDVFSTMFAYIDGNASFPEQSERDDFELKSGEDIINGGLHELFLTLMEDGDFLE